MSVMKARKLLGKGYEGFLCHVMKIEDAESSLEDIPMVREFLDVFPDEIPNMSPFREVEFCIDLILGATPISRTSYWIVPVELNELKAQLEELLEDGYI